MTEFTRWISGMAGFSGAVLIYYLVWTIFAQFKSGDVSWQDSKPTRLAISMVLFGITVAFWIAAPLVAPSVHRSGASQYMIWAAWCTCWLAEMTAISAIGRISLAVVLNALWSAYIIAWRF